MNAVFFNLPGISIVQLFRTEATSRMLESLFASKISLPFVSSLVRMRCANSSEIVQALSSFFFSFYFRIIG